MWKYYFGLMRELPEVFRGTVEGYLFWVAGAVSLLASFLPQDARVNLHLPQWAAPASLGMVILYGLLRVNYRNLRAVEALAGAKEAQLEELRSLAPTVH